MPLQKLTIEHAHEAAGAMGGQCLSDTYIDAHSNLKWRCAKGHEWETPLMHIRNRGDWCKVCGGTQKKTLADLQELARSRGGECLAKVYMNASTSMKWRCAEGHEWYNAAGNIYKGQWCRECSKFQQKKGESKMQKSILEDLQKIAKARGGRCLATVYFDGKTHLLWECAENHEWKATSHNIRSGKWCPKCAVVRRGLKRSAVLSLEDAQKAATNRGGKCLSLEYKNTSTSMRWECAEGHQWNTDFNHIRSGTWCPQCLYKGEEETRLIFEELSGMSFVRRRNILVAHPRYELDGFNATIRVAFEHHGKQHYQYVSYFHKNGIEDFETQQRIDEERRTACEDEWITLIEVPYNVDKRTFIANALIGII